MRITSSLQIYLTLILLSSYHCFNSGLEDTALTNGRGTFNEMNLNSLTVFFGINTKKTKTQNNLEIQLGMKNVLIGDYQKVKWGIPCGTAAKDQINTCLLDEVRISNLY